MDPKELQKKILELKDAAAKQNIDISSDLENISAKLEDTNGSSPDVMDRSWQVVELARKSGRPTTLEYINMIADSFMELHGDRCFADDAAMVGGVGIFEGQPVTFIGHQKGRNMKESMKRNFGMANAEGYRKALRLAKQAEKFSRPIVTFIDTQGAYCGISAEERGVGEAIARNLKEFSVLETPVICIVTGEGGSGGALGIGVGDETYMLENTIYSVISPEGCASILFHDASKAKEAAKALKNTSADLLRFGIIDGIIPESPGGAHTDPEYTAKKIKAQVSESLKRLTRKSTIQLLRDRGEKLQSFGAYQNDSGRKAGFIKRFLG